MISNKYSQTNESFEFVVNKQQVNKKKILLTSILYDKIAYSALQSVNIYRDLLVSNSESIELNFIKNAFLDDQLIVQNNIQTLSNSELALQITVIKKKRNHHDIICKAVFWYQFKKAS
ncbi:MAG: hypothetical protein JKY69_06110 [Flavobacteriaceae bacterium]|nr:hypothetical protein [Flavobacteriaceae bacterium]MBL4905056.1 hypothetical protein [Flavobacteriaceae bacterium]